MKYVEENVPSHLKVKVVHLHEGCVSRNQLKRIGRTNTKYVTICKLVNDKDEVVSVGISACSPKESPTRQVGRAVAVGRALAMYFEETHSA